MLITPTNLWVSMDFMKKSVQKALINGKSWHVFERNKAKIV